MSQTIVDILDDKGRKVFSTGGDATVFDALQTMADNNVGALLVMSVGQVIGIFSERDYARKVLQAGFSSPETPVRTFMSSEIFYAKPDQTVEEALAIMTEKRCRHLPVLDNHELIGLVSIGDLVKATIAAKEFIISQLEDYIQGG